MSTAQDIGRPLRGVRIVEFEGLGPGPLAAMMLADFGAEVTTLVRPGPAVAMERLAGAGYNPLRRGKRIEAVDLKMPEGLARAMQLIAAADALIEGNRPGVMERLGLEDVDPKAQYDKATWPALKMRLAKLLHSQSRAYWCELLEGSDVCFAPVLSLAEAAAHPHHCPRGTYQTDAQGAIAVAPAPRFSPLTTHHSLKQEMTR